MKFFFIAAFCCSVSTPALAQTSFSDILGKTLKSDAGTVVIKKNGTGSGALNGQKLKLKWTAENGKFCRQGKLGKNDIPKKCQSIRIKGNTISFINPDGSLSSSYSF